MLITFQRKKKATHTALNMCCTYASYSGIAFYQFYNSVSLVTLGCVYKNTHVHIDTTKHTVVQACACTHAWTHMHTHTCLHAPAHPNTHTQIYHIPATSDSKLNVSCIEGFPNVVMVTDREVKGGPDRYSRQEGATGRHLCVKVQHQVGYRLHLEKICIFIEINYNVISN